MSRIEPNPEGISRKELIDLVRAELMKHTDDETSLCKAAGVGHFFCGGLPALADDDLRARYAWIVRKRPGISRAELESIANLWQLTQQEVRNLPTACDVQAIARDTCAGWLAFTNEQLSHFYFELTGRVVPASRRPSRPQ